MSSHPENRLKDSASPYLRSAAHQPIDWHEWGDPAFARAESEDKPILLDIGAVWCHWCHVIDRESYENPEIAKIISENFVAVKVDRDERPDVDARYQSAVSAISGQGGWPLTGFSAARWKTVFRRHVFSAGRSRGRPGFRRILLAVADSYKNKRAELERAADHLADAVAQAEVFTGRACGVRSRRRRRANHFGHAAVRHQEWRLRPRAEISARLGDGPGSRALPANKRKASAAP